MRLTKSVSGFERYVKAQLILHIPPFHTVSQRRHESRLKPTDKKDPRLGQTVVPKSNQFVWPTASKKVLEEVYDANDGRMPEGAALEDLAKRLNVEKKRVVVWFEKVTGSSWCLGFLYALTNPFTAKRPQNLRRRANRKRKADQKLQEKLKRAEA